MFNTPEHQKNLNKMLEQMKPLETAGSHLVTNQNKQARSLITLRKIDFIDEDENAPKYLMPSNGG